MAEIYRAKVYILFFVTLSVFIYQTSAESTTEVGASAEPDRNTELQPSTDQTTESNTEQFTDSTTLKSEETKTDAETATNEDVTTGPPATEANTERPKETVKEPLEKSKLNRNNKNLYMVCSRCIPTCSQKKVQGKYCSYVCHQFICPPGKVSHLGRCILPRTCPNIALELVSKGLDHLGSLTDLIKFA